MKQNNNNYLIIKNDLYSKKIVFLMIQIVETIDINSINPHKRIKLPIKVF